MVGELCSASLACHANCKDFVKFCQQNVVDCILSIWSWGYHLG